MVVPLYVWVATAVCCFSGTSAIYFPQERPTFCLPSDSKAGALVGRVFAYQNGRDRCMGEAIRYDVIEDSRHFTVNASGWIVLKVDILTSDVIELNISASCFTLECTEIRNITTVTIDIHDHGDDTQSSNLTEDRLQQMCFEGLPVALYVEENQKDISLGNLNNCANKDGYRRIYTILKPKDRFTITTASELTVTKELDRETLGETDDKGKMDVSGKQPLKVSCELVKGSRLFPAQRRRLRVMVLDVNDNPPIFQQLNNTQHEQVDIDLKTDKANSTVSKVVLDMDVDNSTYQLKVFTDPLKICKPAIRFYWPHGKSVGLFTIDFQNLHLITNSRYRCQVALVDTQFEPFTPTNYTNKVTITVNFHRPPKNTVPTAQSIKAAKKLNFYRNATRLARMTDDTSDVTTTYSLENDIFKITSSTGIVYVDDVEALAVADDSISLFIIKSKGDGINVLVNMFGTPRTENCYDDMCSWHRSTDSCVGSCGVGLLRGGCVMRGSATNTGMSRHYSTCTHDPVTCPDGECDELEDKFPMLCPQDCTTRIVGPGKLNISQSPPTGRGVLEAVNPFWCEDDDWSCYSGFGMLTHERRSSSVTAKRSSVECPPLTTPTSLSVDMDTTLMRTRTLSQDTATTLYNITDQSQMVALVTEETTPTCDNACGTAIGLGIGAVIAISFSLFMLWFTKRRNDRRKNNLKHVGSVVSMSAVPSDYVEDRERQMSYSSPSWSPKGPINPSHIQSLYYEHGKWEVPRENLTLDKTIGEGEFGLVVKANAVGIGGDNRPRDVAVKMLKHCSTQLEEQDLWSEFTLLTDVSHPNVIRLLGACTGDGPFYVIVEYCEHGCLLKYLRRSRLVENGYINTRMRYRSPNANEQTDPEKEGDLLDLRDLLSFAWQIAKGMGYLSEIKLVHRDLAARNVLVADGKVLKISDFGLTRDVYEADTYLKRSRGRIPVKWLAPESLFAQIYTTRSDVWSYGIVLWEIVTLGAPPYPGIPPERLYNLLMGGYRMDKPEFCPDEMYAVMQKCWKIDAADRPSFACLANIFDRILQEKTGYLDLSQGCSNVRDLYSKCFDTSGVSEHTRNTTATPTSTSQDTHAEVHQPTEDLVDNINLKTVSNELYNQDTYLTPTVTSKEDDNKSVPLLGNQTDTPMDDTSVPNVEQTDSKTEKDVPLFIKKMLENKSPGHSRSTGNKNKNVIYPSEKLSLLMENGTAKFSNNLHDTDDSLRIELD